MNDKPDSDKLADSNLPYQEKKIGDHTYRVTRLDWWGVNDVINRLTEILGPSLSGVGQGVALREILKVDTSEILPVLMTALGRATDEYGQELQQILGLQTVVEDGDRSVPLDKPVMGVWFSKHPREALPWLWFALEVQVRDFIEPLIGAPTTPPASRKSGRTTSGKAATAKGRRSQST